MQVIDAQAQLINEMRFFEFNAMLTIERKPQERNTALMQVGNLLSKVK